MSIMEIQHCPVFWAQEDAAPTVQHPSPLGLGMEAPEVQLLIIMEKITTAAG